MNAPDDAPSSDEIKKMHEHISHEMERLLWIGHFLCRWRWLLRALRQDTVLQALRTAYAGHARALLEFYHDGRVRTDGTRKPRKRRAEDDTIDVQLYDYTGAAPGTTHPWGADPDHALRLADGDKLLAHLSTGRLEPDRRDQPDWGDAEDRRRFRTVVERIMAEVPDAATLFPDTAHALRETACP